MKVLVIGSGGREHAVIKSLQRNKRISAIYCAPGNGGTGCDSHCVPVKDTDIDGMTDFVLKNSIDYVVVTPDDPLVLGMTDALEEKGIRCFGPAKSAARIEGSKIFSKNLMKKYNIPTASYEVFTDPNDACNYIKSVFVNFPLVIKADGLARGKGVIIAENQREALDAIESMMGKKIFGSSGSSVVIEEFLTGPEVTVLAFTDGKTIKPMISSMDHKRINDGNLGPNTGGMGVIAPNPYYTKEIASVCEEKIIKPTINALQNEGILFKGCLYFGLMLTQKGPYVIEYNCRFGDPETQAILPLLETDLFDIFEAVTDGRLNEIEIKWKNEHSACIVLASGGYPSDFKTGIAIKGLNAKGQIESDAFIFHAGTQYKDGTFLTSGGRVMGVCATGSSLETALEKAYRAAGLVSFEGMHYRKDIGRH
ncbi:MAG: phosphoribosylamine--glycine ligase [Treponema sp.]|nr:phosphoribosylamine--glycine ligase [Treponema sp.]